MDTIKTRRLFLRQFSLSLLMLVVTGIACYLGGRIHGYRQGIAIWDSATSITKIYSLDDLSQTPASGKSITPDEFTVKLKNEVMPGVWMESGGKASAKAFPERTAMVVTANELVQQAVYQYLLAARTAAVRPLVNPTP